MALSDKHEAVAQAYFADAERIGWKAYQKAYPEASQHAAETCFGRLLKKVEFAARIAELTQQAADVAVVTVADVLLELKKLAFVNMLDFITIGPDGLPYTDFSNLTRDQAAAIAEVNVEIVPALEGQDGEERRPEVRKVRFKLADKRGPLTDLGKYLGLFKDGKGAGGEGTRKDEAPWPGGDRFAEIGKRFGNFKIVDGGKGT